MPWTEVSVMESREEFCRLAVTEGANMRALCRRYGVSPTTGYRWLRRYEAAGRAGLQNQSRRPHSSPYQTAGEVEAAVVELRGHHPAWGGRKLRARLLQLEYVGVPSASTITQILERHGLLHPAETALHAPWNRFEAPFPNDLWQMDYKGHFPLARAGRCHPLTVLDDHARFAVGVRALEDERRTSVQTQLIGLFSRYGLPNRILCDNGPPWGSSDGSPYTALRVWLLHLDVQMLHGRPFHPQTQGKEERFHRTLQDEVLATRSFDTLAAVQVAFDAFRESYNQERPHEAIGLVPPISRYTVSPRAYPTRLPAIIYPTTDLVRTVTSRGVVKFKGQPVLPRTGLRQLPRRHPPHGTPGHPRRLLPPLSGGPY